MPIDVKFSGWDKVAAMGDKFSRARKTFNEGLFKEAKTYSMDAVGVIKRKYLSGPRSSTTLGVVSGRLRSSITEEVAANGDDITVSVGSNVAYARFHEMGFDGSMQIPAFMRIVSKVFGRDISPVAVSVRSFARKIKYAGRPFITPGMEEAIPAFENSIRRLLAVIPEWDDNGGE